MKLLVYPHNLSIGGSQINAVDLAALHAENGHDVAIYGIEGPLVEYIEAKGLPYLPARRLRYRPAPSRIAQLTSIARQRRVEIIHGYEWPPCLDAYFGAHLIGGVPPVCTVLSMAVSPLVPPSIPLVMGTERLGTEARRYRPDVFVLEPPINTSADHPGIDGAPFRSQHSIGDNETLIVTVSRLSIELKLDALVDAIDAVGRLADRYPARLVIVGDGSARVHLEARASIINKRSRRTVVSFAGALLDPRPAYAAADVVVGMGSSSLRAMAMGKPVIVQGEAGFSLPFLPETLPTFLWQGFWGVGDGSSGSFRLADHLETVLVDAERRSRLGDFGRATVVERFSLERAARVMEEIYSQITRSPAKRRRRSGEPALMASRALRLEVEQHRPSTKRARALAERDRLDSAALRNGGRD